MGQEKAGKVSGAKKRKVSDVLHLQFTYFKKCLCAEGTQLKVNTGVP